MLLDLRKFDRGFLEIVPELNASGQSSGVSSMPRRLNVVEHYRPSGALLYRQFGALNFV